MRNFLLALTLMTVPLPTTAAWAAEWLVNGTKQTLLVAGQHYAIRALCAPGRQRTQLEAFFVFANTSTIPAGDPDNEICVNGKIGADFTVPADPAGAVAVMLLVSARTPTLFYNPRIVINNDCAEGPETTCDLTVRNLGEPFTIKGKVTYPGDHDWVKVGDSPRFYDIVTVAKDPCRIAASVVTTATAQFIRATGAPSGCDYTLKVTER